MPDKANADRRHKIPRARYRVTNWPHYDAALVRRGSLTLWITEAALAAWHAPATGKRGGQPVYADVAIETGLALRLVFHQPLRQTEGAMRSIVGLLGVDLPIPDHTTFSRRGGGLAVLPQRVERNEPLHLLVDSTGVKIYGEGEAGQGSARIASGIPAKGNGWIRNMGSGLAGAGVSCISRLTPIHTRSPRSN